MHTRRICPGLTSVVFIEMGTDHVLILQIPTSFVDLLFIYFFRVITYLVHYYVS